MLHTAAVRPFLAMREAAARAGFDLVPVSSFRDFERQRAIWNAKFRGERPALDRSGRPVDMTALDPRRARGDDPALVGAARREPAPLGQRHRRRRRHASWRQATRRSWRSRNTGAAARLPRFPPGSATTCAGSASTGPTRAAAAAFSPSPGTCPTRPSRRPALARMTPALLAEAIAGGGVEGEAEILARLPEIRERYVLDVDAPPRMRSRYARLSSR